METKSLSILHSMYLCTYCVLGTVLGARNTTFSKIRVLAHDTYLLVDRKQIIKNEDIAWQEAMRRKAETEGHWKGVLRGVGGHLFGGVRKTAHVVGILKPPGMWCRISGSQWEPELCLGLASRPVWGAEGTWGNAMAERVEGPGLVQKQWDGRWEGDPEYVSGCQPLTLFSAKPQGPLLSPGKGGYNRPSSSELYNVGPRPHCALPQGSAGGLGVMTVLFLGVPVGASMPGVHGMDMIAPRELWSPQLLVPQKTNSIKGRRWQIHWKATHWVCRRNPLGSPWLTGVCNSFAGGSTQEIPRYFHPRLVCSEETRPNLARTLCFKLQF